MYLVAVQYVKYCFSCHLIINFNNSVPQSDVWQMREEWGLMEGKENSPRIRGGSAIFICSFISFGYAVNNRLVVHLAVQETVLSCGAQMFTSSMSENFHDT
jgi:hypothetical protein